jgi:hypothetical protein
VKSLEISELYKKCGFKSASGFALHHTWVDGTPPEPRLAQAFVFDTATAENYLSTDGPTTWKWSSKNSARPAPPLRRARALSV